MSGTARRQPADASGAGPASLRSGVDHIPDRPVATGRRRHTARPDHRAPRAGRPGRHLQAADLNRALTTTYAVVLLNTDDNAMGKARAYAGMYNELTREAALRTLRFWRPQGHAGGLALIFVAGRARRRTAALAVEIHRSRGRASGHSSRMKAIFSRTSARRSKSDRGVARWSGSAPGPSAR